MPFLSDDEHPLEKFKESEDFDEDVGRWLADEAGDNSEADIEEYINDVRRLVNSEMKMAADIWRSRHD